MTLLGDEGLTVEELTVWRMLQRAQVRITRHLEGELLVAHDEANGGDLHRIIVPRAPVRRRWLTRSGTPL